MKKIKYIPIELPDDEVKHRLKVAAYCRVSTKEEQQQFSLKSQIEYYTYLINNNFEWKLAGVFFDYGKSGLRRSDRTGLEAMLKKARKGKIDLIITKSIKIRNFVLILLLVISVVFYLFAYLNSYSITKKIKLLANKMRDMHNGKLTALDIPYGKDEIGGLIEDYNYMTERMTCLIEEQYKSGQKLKSAELKVLQAQINPHFLYNTLDMINW